MTRTDRTTQQHDKAIDHGLAAQEAAWRILAGLRAGEWPTLADAKILEAAGCWYRRNGAV